MIATDELRSMAASVGLEVPQAATLMMGAADAIDRLDAENAKLRERIAELEELLPDSGRWFSAGTVEAYISEIAKLRELTRDMYERFYGVVIENWSYSTEDFQMYERRMRELGVEL